MEIVTVNISERIMRAMTVLIDASTSFRTRSHFIRVACIYFLRQMNFDTSKMTRDIDRFLPADDGWSKMDPAPDVIEWCINDASVSRPDPVPPSRLPVDGETTLEKKSRVVTVNLPRSSIKVIDMMKDLYLSRSEFIRTAIILVLKDTGFMSLMYSATPHSRVAKKNKAAAGGIDMRRPGAEVRQLIISELSRRPSFDTIRRGDA
jgi:Arc/MetJ-type ribon-helix-helix transcriptional regulator